MKINKTSLLILISLFFCSACANNATINAKESIKIQTKPSAKNLSLNQSPTNLKLGLLNSIVGDWQVQDWQLRKNGEWQALNGASWSFRALHDGSGLEDAWMSYSNDGQTPSGYANGLRKFDVSTKQWQASWLSSSQAKLIYFSGREENGSVIFTTTEEDKGRLTRHVFSNIKQNSFNWQIEWSKDKGDNWLTVYRVLANK